MGVTISFYFIQSPESELGRLLPLTALIGASAIEASNLENGQFSGIA